MYETLEEALSLHFQDEFNLLVHLVRRHGVSFGPQLYQNRPQTEVIINAGKKKTLRWLAGTCG